MANPDDYGLGECGMFQSLGRDCLFSLLLAGPNDQSLGSGAVTLACVDAMAA